MIQVFTATGCRIPYEIPGYCIPVEAGSALREEHLEGYQRDNDGENISDRNQNYCELSVLYWGWKNSNADIKGLCHYRRFFHESGSVRIYGNDHVYGKDLVQIAPTERQIESMLENCDVILPIPYHPYPDTVGQDLLQYVYPGDIRIMENVLANEYGKYYETYCAIKDKCHIPYCNMMIARASVYDAYCAWLFPLLMRVGDELDLTQYDAAHRRIYGYLAEVLLSVWVETNALRVSYLNLAQVWDLWKRPEGISNLVLIDRTIRHIESIPVISALYHVYSSIRYPIAYQGYMSTRQLVQDNAIDRAGQH